MKRYIIFTLFISTGIMACNAVPQEPPSSNPISIQQTIQNFSALNTQDFIEISKREDSTVIDVRTPEEIASGKIVPEAEELDYYEDNFKEQLNLFPKDKTYVVYCRSGNRSGQTVKLMKNLGFEEVYDLSGGIQAYKEYEALHAALDDEYKAYSTYENVLQDFGDIRPFIHIQQAELQHITTLHQLFEKYDIEIPENPWVDKAPRFSSVTKACVAGKEGEITNAALYEKLLTSTDKADVLNVFQALQSASENNHLPAFEKCAG